jgi:hypothetical protein
MSSASKAFGLVIVIHNKCDSGIITMID